MIFRHRILHALHSPIQLSLRLLSTSSNGGTSQAPISNPSNLSDNVRTLMRSTPHPLTIVVSYFSTKNTNHSNPEATTCGLLVSSFNTISLHPNPFVSFNIKRPSSTYDAIYQSGRFTASGISNAAVADAFAKARGDAKAWKNMVGDKGKLRDGEGGTWWMVCKLTEERCVEVGDHTVVVGEVLDAASYIAGAKGTGLVYLEGSYRKVGEVLDVRNEVK